MNLEQRRKKNLEIYQTMNITKSGKPSIYGNKYHGEYAVQEIIDSGSEFVVDIGCGHNQFINNLNEHNIDGVGIDIANKRANIVAPAHLTTLDDNVATHITSFDCMEHLEPDGVSEVLNEWKRIAKPECKYIFSIATWPTKKKGIGKWQLHPTVWSPKVWQKTLNKHNFIIDKIETIEVKTKRFRVKVWGTIKK